jgi:hypothetical protein
MLPSRVYLRDPGVPLDDFTATYFVVESDSNFLDLAVWELVRQGILEVFTDPVPAYDSPRIWILDVFTYPRRPLTTPRTPINWR